MVKYTPARQKANLKWDTKHRERKQYLNTRSTARNFIKKRATLEDLDELTRLIEQQRQSNDHLSISSRNPTE